MSSHVAGDPPITHVVGDQQVVDGDLVLRCEDCQHPASSGVWEDSTGEWVAEDEVLSALAVGGGLFERHLSRCDSQCHHTGPGEILVDDTPTSTWQEFQRIVMPDTLALPGVVEVHARWRQVIAKQFPGESAALVLCVRCIARRSDISW